MSARLRNELARLAATVTSDDVLFLDRRGCPPTDEEREGLERKRPGAVFPFCPAIRAAELVSDAQPNL